MKKYLEVFIEDVQNARFYEAHENLEVYWHTVRKTDHPLKNLVKGFINGATVFELVRLERIDSAKRVWKTHEKYLPLMVEGIENYELFVQGDKLLQELYIKEFGED